MNKEQFKNLDILAQIEYVNNILKEGKTLTAFSEEVEISRKTISKNFSKFGYKYSQSKKQYILANTDVQAGGRKKYYSNITESNIKSTPKKESSIPVINNITTNLEISNHQKNSKKFLINGKSPVIMRGIKTTRKSRQRSLKKKISLLSALFCVQKGGKP